MLRGQCGEAASSTRFINRFISRFISRLAQPAV